MPFQEVPDATMLEMHGTLLDGTEMINRFYVQNAGTLTQLLTNQFCQWLADAYGQLDGSLSTGSAMTHCVATDMRTEGAPQFTSTTGLPEVGGNDSGALPNEVCGMIRWQTAFRGTAGRGRTYLSGFALNTTNGNSPDAGALANMQGFVNELLDGPGALLVVSRYLNNQLRNEAVTNLVTSGSPHPQWTSQRQRRPQL